MCITDFVLSGHRAAYHSLVQFITYIYIFPFYTGSRNQPDARQSGRESVARLDLGAWSLVIAQPAPTRREYCKQNHAVALAINEIE